MKGLAQQAFINKELRSCVLHMHVIDTFISRILFFFFFSYSSFSSLLNLHACISSFPFFTYSPFPPLSHWVNVMAQLKAGFCVGHFEYTFVTSSGSAAYIIRVIIVKCREMLLGMLHQSLSYFSCCSLYEIHNSCLP